MITVTGKCYLDIIIAHLQSQLFNQTSAIIATALDAVLSPLSTNGELKLCLMDYIKSLTTYDRKAVGMSCAIQPSHFLEYNAQGLITVQIFNFDAFNSNSRFS